MTVDRHRASRASALAFALGVASSLVACVARSPAPPATPTAEPNAVSIVGALRGAAGVDADIEFVAPGRADPNASWIVLPSFERAGRTRAGDSAQVLVESRLRAKGVARIARGRHVRGRSPDSAPAAVLEGALARARFAGHRHAVAVTLDTWETGRRPGDPPRVALAVRVHDLADGRVVHAGRATRTGRGGAGLADTAGRAVADALEGLRLSASDDRNADPGAVAHATGAAGITVELSAPRPLGERSSGRVVPSGNANGLGVRASRDDARVDVATADAFEGRATAFFYGRDLPIAALAQFDRIVLEPDNATPAELDALAGRGAATFAYLSVGEVGPGRAWRADVDDAWVIGRNAAWDSDVMDLASGWSAFLDARVDAFVARGYAGLFLDTMDSHVAHARTPDARERQERALAGFVRRTKSRHPALRLIANRGFEVLDEIGPALEAIAAESLYARWDNAVGRHSAVPADDRDWLLGRLERARTEHGVDLIAIDYVPPARRDEARAIAARIAGHDIVPWVATPALDHVGVGTIDVVPREVLMLFDGGVNGRQANAEVHRLLATPLEYLGLVPVYHDVGSEGMPPANLGGRYAGIAHWARGRDVHPELQGWMEAQASAGVPFALFGAPWMTPGSALAARAGLVMDAALDSDSARVRTRDASIGFEKSPPRRFEQLGRQARSVSASNTVHLGLEDGAGRGADLVVTGPWGGIAAQPGAVVNDLDEIVHWIVDPYAFFRRAFALPDAPMPDVTSEGGRRLWFAHIDGDALPSWSELPGRRLGAEVVRDRILDRYRVPHTISVVEAELTRFPEHDDRRARMFTVARELFARPEVEIASHTFSHPFRWRELATYRIPGTHNLDVPRYLYDPVREVAGSAAFIDRELAPPGKRTEVMLWSGDALPNEADLAAADDAGLVNLNGGFTVIDDARPAISLVTPMARTVGKRLQVYAPIMNENVYTRDWTGPFDGFRRVLETFELTDRPRRLKPINVYYHFYIGTKAAGIRSLEEVYERSLAGDVHPITAGDYARRVQVFREAGVARRLDGSWRLHGLGELRSVRVVGTAARLDRARSDGVATQRTLHDGLYLSTDGRDSVRVAFARDDGDRRVVLSSSEEP